MMGANVSTPEKTLSPRQMTPDTMSEALGHRARSRKSSISSVSSGASSSSAQRAVDSSAITAEQHAETLLSPSHPVPAWQMDPLSRDYPMPTEEVNVAEMLNRKPMKWSVGHYIKETSSPRAASHTTAEDRERAARELEARKRELLAAKEQMRRLALPK